MSPSKVIYLSVNWTITYKINRYIFRRVGDTKFREVDLELGNPQYRNHRIPLAQFPIEGCYLVKHYWISRISSPLLNWFKKSVFFALFHPPDICLRTRLLEWFTIRIWNFIIQPTYLVTVNDILKFFFIEIMIYNPPSFMTFSLNINFLNLRYFMEKLMDFLLK